MLYSRLDFCGITGVKVKDISNYIKRKHVVVRKDGLIDSDDDKNSAFIEKRASFVIADAENDDTTGKHPDFPEFDDGWRGLTDPQGYPVIPKEQIKAAKNTVPLISVSERAFNHYHSEKYRVESELKILELQKKMGSLIPTELMGAVISQQSKSFSSAFRQALSRAIDLFILKYKLTGEDAAEMRKVVTETVNKAITDALAESKKQVKAIAKEFSEKRNMEIES